MFNKENHCWFSSFRMTILIACSVTQPFFTKHLANCFAFFYKDRWEKESARSRSFKVDPYSLYTSSSTPFTKVIFYFLSKIEYIFDITKKTPTTRRRVFAYIPNFCISITLFKYSYSFWSKISMSLLVARRIWSRHLEILWIIGWIVRLDKFTKSYKSFRHTGNL